MILTLIRKLFKRRSHSDGTTKPKPKADVKWLVSLIVCLAIPVFLETLDYTVVATTQPHIASVFNRLDLQSYIGTSYLLTSTAFLPLFASVADVFGRHFALQLSLLIFIVGSAISTGATSMEAMLAGRGVAGVGAAGLLTVVRVILGDSRSLDDNNWQVSAIFLLYSIGFIVGPFIGGVLLNASFRWIFAINLPCCVVSMILTFFLIRKKLKGRQGKSLPTNTEDDPINESLAMRLLRIDWIGAALFVAAGILILLALNWGSNQGWDSAKVIACFVIGGMLLAICIFWEHVLGRERLVFSGFVEKLKLAEPMIPLSIFRSYDVCAVLAASFVSGMVMLVMLYFVAIFMTIVTGLSPEKAGVQLVYFAPGMGGGSLLSIFMIRYFRQPKYPIIIGSLIVPIALGLLSMGMDQNKQNLVRGFMVMTGPDERLAIVSAMILFARSLGGTVGLAQCAAVLNAKVRNTLASAVTSGVIDPSDAAALASAAGHGGLSSVHSIEDLPEAAKTLVQDAFREGTRWAFVSLIPWAALAFIMTVFLSNIVDTDRDRDRQAHGDAVPLTPSHADEDIQMHSYPKSHGSTHQVHP
ncbi:hypothetical protein HGRIS_007143 [Hohenbuehelia grisea]|uniref:Major facilitator superfamily (MFS) profile domain-containing protein n=1 Tax=Hohenbuehelia grisea TaxID=104357 RepID=A0ABR3JCU2_9AGAR